jgi:hypothetical protein
VTRLTRSALAGAAIALAACSADAVPPDASSAFERVSAENPRDLPVNFEVHTGRPGANGGIVMDPVSARLDHAAPYRFELGHCGLYSPVDLDGSFWDPLDGLTADGAELDLDGDAEMINATGGVAVVMGDEMRFRTASGSVVRFERHVGEKEFPGCD